MLAAYLRVTLKLFDAVWDEQEEVTKGELILSLITFWNSVPGSVKI